MTRVMQISDVLCKTLGSRIPPSASSDQNLSIFFSLTAEDLERRNFDMIAANESKIGSSTIMPMTEAGAGH